VRVIVTAIVNGRGQVILPQVVREALGEPRVIEFKTSDDGVVTLHAVLDSEVVAANGADNQ